MIDLLQEITFFSQNRSASVPAAPVDPFAYLDSTFSDASVFASQWTVYRPQALSASSGIVNGEYSLQINAGGAPGNGSGSFWFDNNDGILIYQPITGSSWDARLRCRIRNNAGTASPPASNFQVAGLQCNYISGSGGAAQYVHVSAGTMNSTQNRVEWKTHDHIAGGSTDESAFNFVAAQTTTLDIDFRIVRNGQVFNLYWTPTTGSVALLDVTNWNSLVTIDRTSNATPSRTANGAGANQAVSIPNECLIGFMCYSNLIAHDVRIYADEFRVRTSGSLP